MNQRFLGGKGLNSEDLASANSNNVAVCNVSKPVSATYTFIFFFIYSSDDYCVSAKVSFERQLKILEIRHINMDHYGKALFDQTY